MLVFALLIVLVAVGLAFYAQANNGMQDVSFFGNHWHTWTWVPAAVAAGCVAVVWLLTIGYMVMRLARARRANAALRRELSLYELQRAGVAEPAPAADANPRQREREREIVGREVARPAATPYGAPATPYGAPATPYGAPAQPVAAGGAPMAVEPMKARPEGRTQAEHLQAFPPDRAETPG